MSPIVGTHTKEDMSAAEEGKQEDTMCKETNCNTQFTLLVCYRFTFYRYHQPPISLSGAESIRLETSVSGPVPDPFYLFPLDLTAILSRTVSGIPGL